MIKRGGLFVFLLLISVSISYATISNVTLTSDFGFNGTSEDLTASWTNGSTYNITDWRVNGVSKAIVNIPYEPVYNNYSDWVGNQTSNNDYYIISASAENTPAWNAFDGNEDSHWYSGATPSWLDINMSVDPITTLGYKFKVSGILSNGYQILARNDTHDSWTFLSSGATTDDGWVQKMFSSSQTWNYYRLNFSNGASIYEFMFISNKPGISYLKDYSSYNRQIMGMNVPGSGAVGTGGNFTGNMFQDFYYNDTPTLTEMSILTWFRIANDTIINVHELTSKQNHAGNTQYQWFLRWVKSTSRISFAIGTGGSWSCSYTPTTAIPKGEWHHIAAIWREQHMYMIVDGQLIGTASCPVVMPNYPNNTARIGYSLAGQGVERDMDEFKMYNYGITNEEAIAIYNTENQYKSITTYPSEATSVGENWSVCVSADDSLGIETTACSQQLKILHSTSTSTISNVTISSIPGGHFETNNTLQASWDENSYTKKAIVDWRLNSSSIALANFGFGGNDNQDTITRDYSTYNNHATVNGATWLNDTYDFDGLNDYINVTSNDFANQNESTVSLWIKPDLTNESGGIFSESQNIPTDTFTNTIYLEDGYIKFYAYNGTQHDLSSGIKAPADIWTHITATVKANNYMKVYVNGILKNKESVANTAGIDNKVFIGHSVGKSATAVSPQPYFDGQITDVKIYNRELSAEQIALLSDSKIASNETNINDAWNVCLTGNDYIADTSEVCSTPHTIINQYVPIVETDYDRFIFYTMTALYYALKALPFMMLIILLIILEKNGTIHFMSGNE